MAHFIQISDLTPKLCLVLLLEIGKTWNLFSHFIAKDEIQAIGLNAILAI